MHPILQKSFGGLTPQYYFRQLFFALAMFSLFIVIGTRNPHPTPYGIWILLGVSSVLYPYSRFVYESIVGFFMGDNVFYVHAIMMLFAKLFTMLMCWACAIFIAPIGLVYLYFRNRKA